MPRRQRSKPHYGKRFDVSVYFPSREQVESANERTEGLVGYFLSCARRDDAGKWQDDLYTLARSAYLQGAMDTAQVAAKMRLRDQDGKGR